MPELPEVENIGRALQHGLVGRTITQVEVFSPMMRTSLEPLKTAQLPGHKFIDVRRRGRYLWCELDDGRGLLLHFGMSGVVRIEPASVPKRKHEHIFIHLDNNLIFRFECTRRFSLAEVHSAPHGEWPEVLKKLGVEPFSADFTGEYLYNKSRKITGCVKNFIMDNLVVTGIGNIYATETLFACRIDPRRPAQQLTLKECNAIVEHSREILTRAIAAGGTSFSDFLNVDGSEGKFIVQLQAYGKIGQPCPVCGTKFENVRLGGRSSCFCPHCQK